MEPQIANYQKAVASQLFELRKQAEASTQGESSSLHSPKQIRKTVSSSSPYSIKETGLSERFLADLLCKHLFVRGVMTAYELGEQMALGALVIEEVLNYLRKEARIEVRANHDLDAALRYALTERGRISANDAFAKSGYVGPCPVPLDQYCELMLSQSIHKSIITQNHVQKAFEGFVLSQNIMEQLGMAVNSGRAIFIYGPAGSGKTYTIARLAKVFTDACLIPYAISVDETVVELFDPLIHEAIPEEEILAASQKQLADDEPPLLMTNKSDSRWVTCKRPVVVCGGELTMDMLEIRYSPTTREYQAPLQMKANGGLFIIDDMGRQKPSPAQIFNRWIVPMEEHRDFLSLGSGRHFQVPFDEVLIFSSNINPLDLADEAFLRRIGYKVRFDYLPLKQYQKIWLNLCEQHKVEFNVDAFNYLVRDLHGARNVPFLPCHPRDLMGIAMDHAHFNASEDVMTKERIAWAWQTYFVDIGQEPINPTQHHSADGGNHDDQTTN